MKKEVKIGIFAVLMILAGWAGIRFLTGIDVFSRNADYYAAYPSVEGVQLASPVMIRGVKVGTVTGIEFDNQNSEDVLLTLTIANSYKIPTNTVAKISNNGLMGGKMVVLTLGNDGTYLENGDRMQSEAAGDLMAMAGSEFETFKGQFAVIVDGLTKTLTNVNALLEANTASITQTMNNLNSLSGNMAGIVGKERGDIEQMISNLNDFSGVLSDNTARMDSIIGNLNTVSTQLADGNIAAELSGAVDNLNSTLAKINSGDGTMGRLVEDPALYESLNSATSNLSALLADLKQSPSRYVHFSLFGRNEAKQQEKAEKKAEKERQDSIKRANK